MIFSFAAKNHMVSNDAADISAEIRIADGQSKWMVINTTDGQIVKEGNATHPIHAIRDIKEYLDAQN